MNFPQYVLLQVEFDTVIPNWAALSITRIKFIIINKLLVFICSGDSHVPPHYLSTSVHSIFNFLKPTPVIFTCHSVQVG